jgi:hypothetical protein
MNTLIIIVLCQSDSCWSGLRGLTVRRITSIEIPYEDNEENNRNRDHCYSQSPHDEHVSPCCRDDRKEYDSTLPNINRQQR